MNMNSSRTKVYIMWGRFVYDEPMKEVESRDLAREMAKQFGKINTTLAVHGEVMKRVEEQVKKTNGTVGNHDKWIIEHKSELGMVKKIVGGVATAVVMIVGYLVKGLFGL